MHNPICDSATGARPTGQRMPYEMVNLPSLPPAPANRYYDDKPLQHPVQRRCSGSEEDDQNVFVDCRGDSWAQPGRKSIGFLVSVTDYLNHTLPVLAEELLDPVPELFGRPCFCVSTNDNPDIRKRFFHCLLVHAPIWAKRLHAITEMYCIYSEFG